MLQWTLKWTLKRRVWGTYVMVAISTIVVIAGRYAGWWSGAGLPNEIVDQLISALLSFLFIGFFANLLFIRSVQEGLTETVRETLPMVFTSDDKKSIFNVLGQDARATIVRQALRAQLGPKFGTVVYTDIVEDYLKKELDYRKNSSYHINCFEEVGPTRATDPYILDIYRWLRGQLSDYVWVRQSFGYSRDGFREDSPLGTLKVQLVFSMGQLEASVHNDSVFFREVLSVKPDLKDLLMKLSGDHLSELVREIFLFEAKSLQGAILPFEVRYAFTAAGEPLIEIDVENPSGMRSGAGCRIEFQLPHDRALKRFVVTMPRPIEPGAEIVFRKSSTMHELSEFLFLSDQHEGHDISRGGLSPNEPDWIRISTRKWMFPISGVMFFWK